MENERIQNDLLQSAAKLGNLNLVQYAIQKGANLHSNNEHALHLAAENGHIKIVRYLVELGADIHANDDSALRFGAYNGHVDVVKYLVSKGGNVRVHDEYPLRWSAINGHLNVVQYLMEWNGNKHNEISIVLDLARNFRQSLVIDWVECYQRAFEEKALLLQHVGVTTLLKTDKKWIGYKFHIQAVKMS